MNRIEFPEKDGVDVRYAVRGLMILLGVIAAGLVAYTLFQSFIGYLEFLEIGEQYTAMFFTNTRIKLFIGTVAFLLIFLLFFANHQLLMRILSNRDLTMKQFNKPMLTLLLSFIFAFLCGRLLSSEMYDSFLTFINQTDFGYGDTLFNRDVGYYVFSRPFLLELISYISTIWLGILCYTAVVYLITAARLSLLNRRFLNETPMLNHLMTVVVGFVLIHIARYRFALEELLYANFDGLTGAGYTDLYVWGVYYRIAPVLAVALLGLAVIFFLRKHYRNAFVTLLVFPVCLLFTFLAARLTDAFVVSPNAYALQKTSIEANWYSTRRGFGLEELLTVSDATVGTVSAETLAADPGALVALNNLKLADTSAETLAQFKEGEDYLLNAAQYRQMTIDGTPTLVFVAERESVTASALGDGLVMGYASQTDQDGNPVLLMEGLPVLTRSESLPEVRTSTLYFGTQTPDTLIVPSDQYGGQAGIPLTLWNRIAFFLRSSGDAPVSKVDSRGLGLMNRKVTDRVRKVAPFFRYDTPYSVVTDDGRIVWVIEAYATTDRYPSAQSFDGINYIRNVATVTVDAYDGTVTFYPNQTDPISKTYQKIYPTLYTTATFPSDIQNQLRAPELLFKLQMQVLEQYHESNLEQFYYRQGVWSCAKVSQNSEETKRMEPTLTWVSLPNEQGTMTASPVLLALYTDKSGSSVTAAFMVGTGKDNRGKRTLFAFGAAQSLQTPQAFETALSTSPEYLMRQVSWQSSGLTVTRGAITPVFVNQSLLYTAPVYSVASTGEKRLIAVAMGAEGRVVVRNTAAESLTALLNAGNLIGSPAENLLDIGDLIDAVILAYDQVKETGSRNDWQAYGNAMNELESAIRRLESGKNSLLSDRETLINE